MAIETGRIRINKKFVTAEYLIRNGDKIYHLIHRHEPPVSDEPITIISRSDEVIVVHKPSGMPVLFWIFELALTRALINSF